MSFINNYSYTIRRSNNDLFYFYINNGLYYRYYKNSETLLHEINILENYITNFTYFNFCIDKNDDIYGVLSFDNLRIIKCKNNDFNFESYSVLKFDFQKFSMSYPYIKKIDNTLHIFYYVYSLEANSVSYLYHLYNEDGVWNQQKIDTINHLMLNEYKVIYLDNRLIVFYLNMINNVEELFCCSFDCINKKWDNPIQITNTSKNKLYLDVIYKDDFFHISFCHKVNNNYAVSYLKLRLENLNFTNFILVDITEPSIYMYPSFATYNDTIYLMWIYFNKLYTTYSIDNGNSWSINSLDNKSTYEDFLRTKYLTNYNDDATFYDNTLFVTDKEINFLGFK